MARRCIRISVDEGFVKGDSRNLPIVKTFTMANFFNSANFLSPEMRNVKTERSTRADYADEAVGYVQVKREPEFNLCHVKARITPEHRVTAKNPYTVICIINETQGEILKAVCEDCAACEDIACNIGLFSMGPFRKTTATASSVIIMGGCKHAVAFITWLHRRGLEPSVTDTACYWRRSKLSLVGSSIKSIKANDIVEQIKDTASATDKRSFFEASKLLSADSLLRKHIDDVEKNHSIFHLMNGFKDTGLSIADDFISFAADKLASVQLDLLAQKSKEQSASPLWHALRFGRITASKLYEAANCVTENGTLVNTILGASKFKPSAAMKRGTALEKDILKTVENYYDITTSEVGLVIRPDEPIFGASPDGVSEHYVWEVKAPSSEKTFQTYFTEDQERPAPKYNAQMQLQMYLLGKEMGIFAVAKPDYEQSREVAVLFVEIDMPLVMDLMSRAREFWKTAIFPKLYNN